MDSGLMFTWLPKLFIFGLGVAAILCGFTGRRNLAWTCGAIFPILYDVAKAVWIARISPPADPVPWFPDVAGLCGIGLLATIPGAIIGSLIGGWARGSTSVR